MSLSATGGVRAVRPENRNSSSLFNEPVFQTVFTEYKSIYKLYFVKMWHLRQKMSDGYVASDDCLPAKAWQNKKKTQTTSKNQNIFQKNVFIYIQIRCEVYIANLQPSCIAFLSSQYPGSYKKTEKKLPNIGNTQIHCVLHYSDNKDNSILNTAVMGFFLLGLNMRTQQQTNNKLKKNKK